MAFRKDRRRRRWWWLGGAAVLLGVSACLWLPGGSRFRPPPGEAGQRMRFEVTGYCDCQSCCGWERTWYGKPVVAQGPNRGKPKAVGVTASGTKARRGTVAADPSVLPMGTIVHVPGYGYGRVEDRGGAIRGRRLDLFFPRHEQALEWGRQRVEVTVWRP